MPSHFTRRGGLRAASLAVGLAAGLAALAVYAAPALAQAPPSPIGYTGAVVSTTEQSVILTTKDGKTVTVAMSPGWTVAQARASNPHGIKVGDFIATTNTNVDPATGRSSEVRVFERGYRPEFDTHPMPQANTSMTHGVVAASAADGGGQALQVVNYDGIRHIAVPQDVKVTAYDLRDRTLIKPGVTVQAITRQDPDGVWRASRLLLAGG